jgi:hypothetical protein
MKYRMKYDVTNGFSGLLTIVFITLKLTSFITWSWWWVLAPLWAPLALLATLGLCCGLVYLIAHMITKR